MKQPELLITTGELSGKRFSVKEGGLRLGRSSSNDIHVPDEELSRNHCLFELDKDGGIRVTDLASANGTFLNGKALEGDPVHLNAGDLIEVGSTIIRVVGEDDPVKSADVDLGLGDSKPKSSVQSRRSPLANLLWLIAAVAICVAGSLLFFSAPPSDAKLSPVQPQDESPALEEMVYEKVEANSYGIFRFELTLSKDGVMSVRVDDVPKENRHLVKSERLDEKALAELGDILAFRNLRDIDREYVGAEPEPPSLESWMLRCVYSTRARSIRIVNTQGPEAFRTIREKLEAFSKNQLGVWALQYSRDKLVELAQESIRLGKSKWDDREVQHGNLFGAVAAFKEAVFYLDTVNPKPGCVVEANNGLRQAVDELERRYRDQRFLADRALNLRQWDVAQRELGVLMEMIPDRDDERHREAAAKLIDVEKRMKGEK